MNFLFSGNLRELWRRQNPHNQSVHHGQKHDFPYSYVDDDVSDQFGDDDNHQNDQVQLNAFHSSPLSFPFLTYSS